MNKSELNQCYNACKDLLLQLGLAPSDKRFKEMLSDAGIPKPDVSLVKEPSTADFSTPESFFDLMDGLMYTDNSHMQYTDYYNASKEIDRFHSKTSHGYLTDGPNMFTRAFNTYASDKLQSEGKRYSYPAFENENHLWYSGYYKTHQNLDERRTFSKLFDKLIDDLKSRGILDELLVSKKLTMDDVDGIIDKRKNGSQRTPSERVAQRNMSVHR